MRNVGNSLGVQFKQTVTSEINNGIKHTGKTISSELAGDSYKTARQQASRKCGGFTGMVRALWRMLKDLVTLKMFWGGSYSTVPANAEHMAEKVMQANIPPVSSPQQPVLQNLTDNITSAVEQEMGAEAQAGLQKTSGWFSWRKILGGTVALAGLAVFHKEAGLAAGKALEMTPESVKKLADRAGKAIGGYVPDGFKASAGEAFGKAGEIWTSNADALRTTTFSAASRAYENLPPIPESVKTSAYKAYDSTYETVAPHLGQAWETVANLASAGLEKVGNAWPKSVPPV